MHNWEHSQIDKVVEGQVIRLDHTGAFVHFAPNADVFIPLAEIAWFEIEHPSQALQEGDTVKVKLTGQREDGCIEGSIRQVEQP